MTTDRIALIELLEKSSDTDFLREMLGFVADKLMALETEGLCGAGHGERRADRLFIGVHLRGVDMAIADRQRGLDGGAAGIALQAKGSEAELGHANALGFQIVH